MIDSIHPVDSEWRKLRADTLRAEADAINDLLAHLADVDEMLADGSTITPIQNELNSLSAKLRSMRTERIAAADHTQLEG